MWGQARKGEEEVSDKKIIAPESALAILELALKRKQAAIETTMDDLDTLQESHREASEHLWGLQDEVSQIRQAIRLLQ